MKRKGDSEKKGGKWCREVVESVVFGIIGWLKSQDNLTKRWHRSKVREWVMWILEDKHVKAKKERIQKSVPDIFLEQQGSLDSIWVSEGRSTGKWGSEVSCMVL